MLHVEWNMMLHVTQESVSSLRDRVSYLLIQSDKTPVIIIEEK